MKLYQDIQKQIDADFELYLKDLFSVSSQQRKYYYWSIDFFETVGNLSFKHYSLNLEQKDSINEFGKLYFESDDVQFSINKNSHRNDITIKNIHKLFSSDKISGQSSMYEYIKEYILWQLLLNLKKEKDFSTIIEQQKKNFLITYITYLCNEHVKPIHRILKDDYLNYTLSNQGQELDKKLKDLELNHDYKNPDLTKKIERLYILKKEEAKIHFVFSRLGGGEKEELRELLEIMGKEETGKLYRGQANSSWGLDASITREPKYSNNEAEMYYDILSLKPDAFQNDKTVYERLITMQHYGMPTRLMDITRNPLVAIFFACNNWECRKNDGVIFTFSPKNKSEFLNFEDPKLEHLPVLFNHNNAKETKESKEFLSKVWFIKGVAKNQRINNQSGDFIFVGNGENVKQELHQLPKMTIIIDSETKKVLLEQLESLNIHGGAVYPDLTHMSNYIRNKYLNETKSTSASKLIQALNPEISKPEKIIMKRTKFPSQEVKIESFDFEKIKNKDRDTQLTTFSKLYNLNKNGLEKIIEDFLFTEKEPFRDEVAKVMNDNPSMIKEKEKIDLIRERIITLAKIIETSK